MTSCRMGAEMGGGGGGGAGGIQVCMTNNDERCITNYDKWGRDTYFLYQK